MESEEKISLKQIEKKDLQDRIFWTEKFLQVSKSLSIISVRLLFSFYAIVALVFTLLVPIVFVEEGNVIWRVYSGKILESTIDFVLTFSWYQLVGLILIFLSNTFEAKDGAPIENHPRINNYCSTLRIVGSLLLVILPLFIHSKYENYNFSDNNVLTKLACAQLSLKLNSIQYPYKVHPVASELYSAACIVPQQQRP